MELTLVTWNLKGSEGPDVAVVAEHAAAVGADVVVLQEVQRHQARAVARRLGAASVRWGFKHWPLRTWPEGMAVIGVSRRASVRTRAMSFRFRPWSWRRRVFQLATIDLGEPGTPVALALTLANAHLSPHARAAMRVGEVETMVEAVSSAPGAVVIAGDLNDGPRADFFARLAGAGLRDAWADIDPGGTQADGATNWRGWRRGTTELPGRRLDYVLVSTGVRVVRVVVPRPGEDGFARFAALSDHLPVAATLSLG